MEDEDEEEQKEEEEPVGFLSVGERERESHRFFLLVWSR